MRYVIAAPIRGFLADKIEAYRKQHERDILKIPKLSLHCTLLATELLDRKEEQALSNIEEIANTQLEFEGTCKEIDTFDNNTLVLKLKKSSKIELMHNRICFNLKSLFLPESLKNAHEKKYGSAYAGPNYKPHITLLHPKEDVLKDSNYFKGDSATIDSLAVWAKYDKWKLLKEFELRK